MAEYCIHVHDDGRRCGAYQQKTSEYCYFHDPEKVEERHAARVKAGKRTRYYALPPSDIPEIEAGEAEDVVIPVLKRAVEQLEGMQPSPEVMRTLTAAASALDRAIERAVNRGSDVQRIEVIYVNDWRGSQAG